jgi:hypothetical protein
MDPVKEEILKVCGLNAILTSKRKNNSLIIGVSVGARYYEGKFLFALVNAINKLSEKVDHCIVAVCDTLQRHNYRLDGKTSEQSAFTMSEIAGDKWIERNSAILKNLKVPYDIIRWTEWLKDTRYVNAFSGISILFDKDFAFKKAIECSIHEFSFRFKKRYEELEFNKGIVLDKNVEESCRFYLLEECAVVMKLWPAYKMDHCEYLLYPSKMTKALEYTYQQIVQADLFKWNKFSFKKTISLSNFHSQKKVEFKKPYDEQESYACPSASVSCSGNVVSPVSSSEEKPNVLSDCISKATSFGSHTLFSNNKPLIMHISCIDQNRTPGPHRH